MWKSETPEKVVIDTNIVISAGISKDGNPARIFELFLLGKIANFTTKEILKEIQSVMQRPRITRRLSLTDWRFIFSTFEHNSILVNPHILHHNITEDPADNKFIDCAIEAHAKFIITGDDHLLNLRTFKTVSVVTPKQFLEQKYLR